MLSEQPTAMVVHGTQHHNGKAGFGDLVRFGDVVLRRGWWRRVSAVLFTGPADEIVWGVFFFVCVWEKLRVERNEL